MCLIPTMKAVLGLLPSGVTVLIRKVASLFQVTPNPPFIFREGTCSLHRARNCEPLLPTIWLYFFSDFAWRAFLLDFSSPERSLSLHPNRNLYPLPPERPPSLFRRLRFRSTGPPFHVTYPLLFGKPPRRTQQTVCPPHFGWIPLFF